MTDVSNAALIVSMVLAAATLDAALQGYYAWVGTSHSGEWRTLETQDWPYTDDAIPHPSLP